MASNPGRNDVGQEGAPAFSDEGVRRIVHAQDRDLRSETFSEDTAELEADLQGRRRLVPVVIAFAALVCFAAIVWYAYSWGTGQVPGDQLPVVTAEVGPEKSRPEQPGGLEVPHQDKLVLNDGEPTGAAPVVERLLPPPETPQPPEPLPEAPAPQTAAIPTMPEPSPAAPSVQEEAASAGEAGAPGISAIPDDAPVAAQLEPGTVDADPPARVDPQTGIALPLMKPAQGETGTREVADGTTAEEPAVADQPESQPQDQIAELLSGAPLETANGPSGAAATGPQAGDIVLQLSSVKSETAAAREWARLQTAHPSLLGDLALSLDTAQVKGSTYYRVQTGPFPTRGAAADICGQLKSRNQDCLVTKR